MPIIRKLQTLAGVPYIHYDAGPNDRWLKDKQAMAEKHMCSRKNYGGSVKKGLIGAHTAFASRVNLPVKYLRTFPGASDEKRAPGDAKYDRLAESINKYGWDPEQAGRISLRVNHKGKPYIYEGNTRLQMAHEMGYEHIPAEVVWYNGGEKVLGPAHPEQIKRLHYTPPEADEE